jgi:hypothetical protein
MIAVAIGLNLLLALGCCYGAWWFWRWRLTLGAIADTLAHWERRTHTTLDPSWVPQIILQGQRGTAQVRHQYQQLNQQLQRLRQLLFLLSLVPRIGRRVRPFIQPHTPPRGQSSSPKHSQKHGRMTLAHHGRASQRDKAVTGE